jgi:hypothetical protein
MASGFSWDQEIRQALIFFDELEPDAGCANAQIEPDEEEQ